MTDIHELMRQIRQHPDYIGGAIFVQGDLPDDLTEIQREDAAVGFEWLESYLVEKGNDYIQMEYGS